MKRIIIGICFIALLPCLGWAQELTGRDIAIKMDAVDTSEDSKRTAIMVINRKGQKLVRKMESCDKKYGPETLMQYDNVDYNIGLSDSLFEQSNLKR